MSAVQWTGRPHLVQPVLIAAFEGWNDAADAASMAVNHLAEQWRAEPFASIDPEEYFDFTTDRPEIRLEDGRRVIDWPANDFLVANPPGATDIVLLIGREPGLRWRHFCAEVIEVATALNCRLVVTLGALLSDVTHTRPTPVYGHAYDEQVMQALHLTASDYEGPTGIIGVLHRALSDAGVNSASLWAAVPSYVPSAPSPMAALALVERACALLDTSVDTDDLEEATEVYRNEITQLVEEDEQSIAYVRHLEEQHDRQLLDAHQADELVNEVERFLRDH